MEKEKQQSFRTATLEKLQSFREKKKNDSFARRGDTQLHVAARAGNLELVQKFISEANEGRLKEFVPKQNQEGETALFVAAEGGHVHIVSELLRVSDLQGAAIKANNSFDPFHVAAKQGHLDVLRELFHAFPALIMTTNSTNSTALDTAATLGHSDVVNFLVEADVGLAKITRNNGKTVLHSAARMGHVEVVKCILSKDSSIGFRTDKKGQTAFHMAVKGHNVEIVQEMLKPDPSVVNLGDNKGNTPLHIATRKGNLEILQALVSLDEVAVNAVNRAGETALGIAENSSNEAAATILREAGAVARVTVNPAKQLKQTVSDIKHDVQSQLRQTRQTEKKVQNIKSRLKKLHLSGLNNAINSNTIVAVLIATVAFAAIFVVPGQYVGSPTDGYTLGEAYIANDAAFIVFLVSDSSALFISLAVVVVQTSLIVVEQKAKMQMVFVMNKLMWICCLLISVSFVALAYVVVGHDDLWLAWSTFAIGATIMLGTMGSMCYCIVVKRIEDKNSRKIKRASKSRSSLSRSLSADSDSEIVNSMYAI